MDTAYCQYAILNRYLLLMLIAGLARCSPSDPAPLTSSFHSGAAFTDATETTRLDFIHDNGMTGEQYLLEIVGSGLALFDYDNDGDLDLYVVQGHSLNPDATPPLPTSDQLYRNDLIETDTLRFTNVTATSDLRATGYGMGVATGDFNNDGWTDLYVLNWGPNQLWRNNGDGTFSDVTPASQAHDAGWSTAASFLDYDRDGWLDLMVVNYVKFGSLSQRIICYASTGYQDYCGPQTYPDAPDQLFRNRRDGSFETVTLPMGMTNSYGSGLGVVAADFNQDGWPDLYVANDGDENQLWMNQAGGRFENRALMAGAAVNAAGKAEASMGVAAADFDGDGYEDLFMTHLDGETNTLFRNTDGNLFEDQSRASGLSLPSNPFTAFGIAVLDYDNDGWLDLFIANGAVNILHEQAQQGIALPLRQTNQLFRNQGHGRFIETTQDQQGLFDDAAVSRGVAAGDIDNDGDTDIVLTNNNGPVQVLRNEVGASQLWIGLRLLGTPAHRNMVGTRVALLRTGAPTLWRTVRTDGSYASASDPRILLGLGKMATYDAIAVTWPDGTVETWRDLALNQYHTLLQGQGTPPPP